MHVREGSRGVKKVQAMPRDLTLPVGEFGQQALQRFARGRGRSADAAVRTAVMYYLADGDSGRAARRLPSLGEGAPQAPSLNVTLDDATWAALAEEAEQQGVTPEALAVHAVLYLVADMDSGRLAELLAEAVDEPK